MTIFPRLLLVVTVTRVSRASTRASCASAAAAAEAQEALVEALDTRVTVTTSSKRGKIVIEFADLDDLQRIANLVTKR